MAQIREFTLEHARRLALLRGYVTYIERRSTALALGDEAGDTFGDVKTLLDTLVAQLRAIRIREPGVEPHNRCPPDHEECNDGSCDVVCTS